MDYDYLDDLLAKIRNITSDAERAYTYYKDKGNTSKEFYHLGRRDVLREINAFIKELL